MNDPNFTAGPAPLKPPLRVGLVGVTGYAHCYLEGLQLLEAEGRIVWGAVTIVNPEQAKDQVRFFKDRRVPIYEDFDSMLEAESARLDWVCLPVGIGAHTRMTLDCLDRGLRVLAEKPLAPTLQEIEAIQSKERESGIAVGVGFQHSYLDETWDIKRRLLAGEIGSIERIDCIGLWPRSRAYYERNDWAGKLHDSGSWILDSPFHNGLSHIVNLALFWGGNALETRADIERITAELYRAKPLESFDTLRTTARFDTGIEAAITLSHSCCSAVDPEIRVTGTRGMFVWRFQGHHTFFVGGEERSLQTRALIPIRELMFERMADFLEGKKTRICTTEQAKGTCKWVNAIHDAARIHDVPRPYRHRYVDGAGETHEVISDIEYYALRAFKERRSFRELGAPWSVVPQAMDTRKYAAFEGRNCERARDAV